MNGQNKVNNNGKNVNAGNNGVIIKPNNLPVKKIRYGHLKNQTDGKISETSPFDLNTLILCPTGNRLYSTLLKKRNNSLFMYSKGIRIDGYNFDQSTGNMILSFNLGTNLSMTEFKELMEWFNGGEKQNV